MISGDPRSGLDKAVGACLTVLVGVTVLVIAMHLIESVAGPLLIILSVAGSIWLVVALIRRRDRGW